MLNRLSHLSVMRCGQGPKTGATETETPKDTKKERAKGGGRGEIKKRQRNSKRLRQADRARQRSTMQVNVSEFERLVDVQAGRIVLTLDIVVEYRLESFAPKLIRSPVQPIWVIVGQFVAGSGPSTCC